MDKIFGDICERILKMAKATLSMVNWRVMDLIDGKETGLSQALVQAAHAGELFIKARIAQEDPLLLFPDLMSSRTLGSSVEF